MSKDNWRPIGDLTRHARFDQAITDWLTAEIKRLEGAMSYAMGAEQSEVAESYHDKLVKARFLLKQHEQECAK